MTTTAIRRHGATHPGPPLGAPALLFAVSFLGAILLGPVTGAGPQPSPYEHTAVLQAYAAGHASTLAFSGWLMLLAATGLALLTALISSRLDYLAPNAPGPTIALVGGLLASVFLATSGMITWLMSRDVVSSSGTLTHALQYLNFLAGGPVHTAALGVLVTGTAVTSIFVARTPRWFALVGIAIGAVAGLSTLVLLGESFVPLVPLGRFAAIIWLLAMALLLPRDRARRGETARQTPVTTV
ncbi:MAG: hypothetical protein JWO46_131 [Nocardioidaceae bacterium]|nr:hypothetical protein [Nocardioidaceae bacterium]